MIHVNDRECLAYAVRRIRTCPVKSPARMKADVAQFERLLYRPMGRKPLLQRFLTIVADGEIAAVVDALAARTKRERTHG